MFATNLTLRGDACDRANASRDAVPRQNSPIRVSASTPTLTRALAPARAARARRVARARVVDSTRRRFAHLDRTFGRASRGDARVDAK